MRGHYMKGTRLESVEIEMRRVPGFAPRCSGFMRRKTGTFRGTEDKEASKKEPVSYEELVTGFLKDIPSSRLNGRIQDYQNKGVMIFKFFNGEHKKRFQEVLKDSNWPLLSSDNGFGAAIYLLSADAFLWDRAKGFITEETIAYNKIRIHGVGLDGYALFCAAKEVCGGSVHLTLSELGDRELISDPLFEVLLNGMLISRYGLTAVLKSKGLEKLPKQKNGKGMMRRE